MPLPPPHPPRTPFLSHRRFHHVSGGYGTLGVYVTFDVFVPSAPAQEFADGETIYFRGDQHATCFFVHKGVVRLEYADGTLQRKVSGGVCLLRTSVLSGRREREIRVSW